MFIKSFWNFIKRNIFERVLLTVGLSDEQIKLAVGWVEDAAKKFSDNAEKREWVVGLLRGTGLSEKQARFAVEASLWIIKFKVEKQEPETDPIEEAIL